MTVPWESETNGGHCRMADLPTNLELKCAKMGASSVTNYSSTDYAKDATVIKELLPESNLGSSRGVRRTRWRSFCRKVVFLLPFVWPVGNRRLQLRVVVCLLLLVAIRTVSVLVPIYSKIIVNSLTPVPTTATAKGHDPIPNVSTAEGHDLKVTSTAESLDLKVTELEAKIAPTQQVTAESAVVPFPWKDILIFILLRSLRGGPGILNCLRSLLFLRVTQHAQKSLRLRFFSHLHALSIRWHLQRKTGEVVRVMDRAVVSVSQILGHLQANLVPVIIDIIIAVIYFSTAFNLWIGLTLFATMVSYLGLTIILSEWRKKFRRRMNTADNQRNASGVDSILNFETVKCFSAEEWESDRYAESVDEYQETEFFVNATANMLGTIQNIIMSLGLMGGCLLTAWYVHKGHFRVGDYVLFLTYVHQLYEPLDLFGAYYRILQQAFVDMENMFDILSEQQEVQDELDAPELQVQNGQIEFDHVCFSYIPSKPLLKDITFSVPPGHTYALVGQSGGGKTTITRLLMRFYDLQSGCIRIDGQDISKVTQRSLRNHIGVVPQDTGLFNKEIRYNIRYGRVTATDREVEDAARTADIHERIVNLVEGYDTKIGERGVKLSGGERQRISIARTMLKSPEIIILDEATSALDTQTERNIQSSLAGICENRTTLIVAHRLSTVSHAHRILVIEEGSVAESGTHDELLAAGGCYARMWNQQQTSTSIDDVMSADPGTNMTYDGDLNMEVDSGLTVTLDAEDLCDVSEGELCSGLGNGLTLPVSSSDTISLSMTGTGEAGCQDCYLTVSQRSSQFDLLTSQRSSQLDLLTSNRQLQGTGDRSSSGGKQTANDRTKAMLKTPAMEELSQRVYIENEHPPPTRLKH